MTSVADLSAYADRSAYDECKTKIAERMRWLGFEAAKEGQPDAVKNEIVQLATIVELADRKLDMFWELPAFINAVNLRERIILDQRQGRLLGQLQKMRGIAQRLREQKNDNYADFIEIQIQEILDGMNTLATLNDSGEDLLNEVTSIVLPRTTSVLRMVVAESPYQVDWEELAKVLTDGMVELTPSPGKEIQKIIILFRGMIEVFTKLERQRKMTQEHFAVLAMYRNACQAWIERATVISKTYYLLGKSQIDGPSSAA
jgi:hypothetical protein